MIAAHAVTAALNLKAGFVEMIKVLAISFVIMVGLIRWARR